MDHLHLYQAIIENLKDDTLRLAYADALEELPPVRIQCRACEKRPDEVNHPKGMMFVGWGHGWQPCSSCHGAGEVLDTSNADRAEFIRAQIKLSTLPPKPIILGRGMSGGCVLMSAGPGYWVADSDIEVAPGTRVDVRCDTGVMRRMRRKRRDDSPRDKFKRNLVVTKCVVTEFDDIEVTLKRDELSGVKWSGEELLKREKELLATHPEWSQLKCPRCVKGYERDPATGEVIEQWCRTCNRTCDLLKGYGGRVSETAHAEFSRNLQFARGFVDSVECRLEELGEEKDAKCQRCNGTGNPTGEDDLIPRIRVCPHCQGQCRIRQFIPSPWAVAVVRALPVARIKITDVTLLLRSISPDTHGWVREVVPDYLFSRMHGEKINTSALKTYSTVEKAMESVEVSACKLVRDKLPK